MKLGKYIKIMLLLILIGVALFLYFSASRYQVISTGEAVPFFVKLDRMTGKTWRCVIETKPGEKGAVWYWVEVPSVKKLRQKKVEP